jgi:predicted nuclease of predicted toxin-antitoxin system
VSIPLYMDHHVDAAITDGLRRRGIDVLTSREDGTDTWEDEPLLERATLLGRVLFTQDDDFLAIAHRVQATGPGSR